MIREIDEARYVSLETFRKDGTGVKTPVWAATVGEKLVVGTDASTYKVTRVRNNPRVRVAVCNASGKKTLGSWYDGTARLLEGDEAARGEAALDEKYGWQRRTFHAFAKLFGRVKNRVVIEIALESRP